MKTRVVFELHSYRMASGRATKRLLIIIPFKTKTIQVILRAERSTETLDTFQDFFDCLAHPNLSATFATD